MPALTAPERETSILMDDSSDTAIITTYQKPLISSLRKNPGATEIKSKQLAKYGGAEFRVPAKLVNIRRPRQSNISAEDAAARMATARAARGRPVQSTKARHDQTPRGK